LSSNGNLNGVPMLELWLKSGYSHFRAYLKRVFGSKKIKFIMPGNEQILFAYRIDIHMTMCACRYLLTELSSDYKLAAISWLT